jgi:RimJ/RimL family protein N-acetyltransferase
VLRIATADDVDNMLEWRNQTPNREVSITHHEISPQEHAQWWSRASVDASRRVLIYEREGMPSGVVTFFDLAADEPATGCWGFFLDAAGLQERGETLPAWIEVMREAVGYGFDELGLTELRGEVLAENVVIRQMNRRFRFVEGTPERRVSDGREITVIPISLHRDNRRQGHGRSR